MKLIIISICLSLSLFLNAKDAINYQAVIRTSDGKVVSSKTIAVRMTIFNDILSQNMVYQETHNIETNDVGIINLKIGLGKETNGIFDNIDWSNGTFFVQVAVDFNGGTNFEIIGISQVLSVPFALYAKKSGELNVANLSDDFVKDLAAKLNINNIPEVVDAKVTNTDYTPIAETKDIVVYQSKNANGIEAILGNIAVKLISSTQFLIGEKGVNGTFDTSAKLTNTNFPNLIAGSSIMKIILLPWDRNATLAPVPSLGWRCVVLTDKGQIYHNFPNRNAFSGFPDGISQTGDINKWDESVVWDLPTRRLPSKTSDIFPYALNPCLPETCYELHPVIRNDNGYGHGGFDDENIKTVAGKLVKFPRHYFFNRSHNGYNPFFFMSGFETSNKLQIIGTYRSNTSPNTSSRVCIFASTDGGRQWYNKYEFANNNEIADGNTLIGKNIEANYVQNTLSIQKRTTIYPTNEVKDPVDIFSYGQVLNILNIIKLDSMIIETSIPHSLKTGDLIVIKKNQQMILSNFDFLCNDNINTKNGGNGKIWKVGVLSPTTFKLNEYVHNPDSNLPVRHIHAINRVKDGYIISTGETYPQGWIIYLQIKASDSYTIVNAYDDFKFIRLNSSMTGVQRTLGTLMLDDTDQTIVFASDEAMVTGPIYGIDGRPNVSISRSSTGIYKGKLADIDDFTKFTCIYEAEQVAYHFKEINGMWIFCGQQGELAISIDKGLSWRKFTISGKILAQQYPKGIDNLGRYFLDQVVIYRK